MCGLIFFTKLTLVDGPVFVSADTLLRLHLASTRIALLPGTRLSYFIILSFFNFIIVSFY